MKLDVTRRSPAEQGEGASATVIAAQVPGITGLLGLAVAVVVIAGLFFARDVLIPITLAVLLSFVLSPIVALLRRLRLPRGPAILLAVLGALTTLGGIGTLVGMQAASLADDAPRYAATIQTKIDRAQAFVVDRLSVLAPAGPRPAAAPINPDIVRGTRANPLQVRVVESEPSVLTQVGGYLEPVVGPFETFVIVLVVAIFILMQKEDLRDRLIRLFGSSDLHRTTAAMDDAGSRLSRYFLSQLAVNTSFGIVVAIGLWLIGLPVPALWGILAGVLRFVPYIGALLGAALPLAIAAGVDPGWSMMLMVAALFIVLEPVIGYVVEPLLYGHSTGLSPLSVVLAAVFWTWIWGPVGLVLSMPLTLCLVVLGRHIPSLEFLDVLLGDRPALTPVESFYQRMLADDPEEALDQAETQLKERSLTAYYDEVALAALKLAAADVARGAIDRTRATGVVESMLVLIDELADADDTAQATTATDKPLSPTPGNVVGFVETTPESLPEAPAEWRNEGAVLCVAGRGVLDDAVTAMLAQLLAKRGFGVRRVGHEAGSRAGIASLDATGVKIVCLSYLEIGGSPSHLRYLVRRIRSRLGNVPVLVGLWPEGEAALSDQQIQKALGADLYVGSLRAAVEACLDQSHDNSAKVAA
ncbi:AI-2E family transporter [Sphingomonas jatrophae]|uniref:Predicted PurR-regulated permease PerM n=1 Tax=Sphingomonas jatrophae TaxID=1166337 RepID=A0A1I6KE67_9SPHN|nr:AI-2E family transporter [Sphingomonas jatrophae]SFR89506.1 Predicted PurR-regulated permease PerM [Sphingomonas jatrophae]